MADLTGQTIANYQLDALLGAGSTGQVYRGRHAATGQVVAIKIMHPNLAATPGFKAQFMREVTAAAALKHPNVIEIYGFGEDKGQLYITMEYMASGSLHPLLDRLARESGKRPLYLGMDLARQASDGLAYAHGQKIIHRNIKPDNLLLTRLGTTTPERYSLKVGDFGLARLLEDSTENTVGGVVGTPAYMSPEQCQGQDIDARTDVYALGVVLYEATTGLLPLEARSLSEAVYKHVNVAPPSPREIITDMPPPVETIIMRCLAKGPGQRYQTAEQLSQALLAAIPLTMPTDNRIGVMLDPPTLTLTPGQATPLKVTVANLGYIADRFTVTVEGMPGPWIQQGQGQDVQLTPGMQASVALMINVPATSDNHAGVYQIPVRARSRELPNDSATATAQWTVQAGYAGKLAVSPTEATARGQGRYRVTVHNHGNTAEDFTFTGKDDTQALTYTFQPFTINVEPGANATVNLAVQGPLRLTGSERPWTFTVQATVEGSHTLRSEATRFIQVALLPMWATIAIGVVILAGVLGILLHH